MSYPTTWYHHEFEPIRTEGDRRIVAPEAEWAEMAGFRTGIVSEVIPSGGTVEVRPRVLVGELFEPWEGPLWRDGAPEHFEHEVCVCHGCGSWIPFTARQCPKEECREERLPRIATMADIRFRFFALADACPNVDFILETRWPENVNWPMWPMVREPILPDIDSGEWYRENVWLAVTVSTQADADRLIPALLESPAEKRVVRCRPVEKIDMRRGIYHQLDQTIRGTSLEGVDWMIVEPPLETAAVQWIRDIVAQCRAVGVPVWVDEWDGMPKGFLFHETP